MSISRTESLIPFSLGNFSSSNSSSNNSNSNDFNSLPLTSTFTASRPQGTSPSKQQLPELVEYEDTFKKLVEKEKQIYSLLTPKLEVVLSELNKLSIEFNANAGQSYMMAGQLKFPLNKTFFKVYCQFKEKSVSLQTLLRAISHWRNDCALVLEKIRLVNEFPENKKECAKLKKQLNSLKAESEKIYKNLKTKIRGLACESLLMKLQNDFSEYLLCVETEKCNKDKKINDNFSLVEASLEAANDKDKSSTKRIYQSLQSNCSENEGSDSEDADTENEIEESKQSNKRVRLSRFYVEPSQDLYDATPPQDNVSHSLTNS
ncbi:MAG TPA: hypothetical protein VHA13_04660 [Gammaproteobacteria bacterium]|nr:hypothetical protein [Gammaproteobacteria bacterium]